MELSRDAMFMGRAVEVRVASLGVLLDSHELAQKNPDNQFIGGFFVLAHALFWKDTGERVFANVEAIRDVPGPYMNQLIELTGVAGDLSRQVAPDAVVATVTDHTSGAAPVPSH